MIGRRAFALTAAAGVLVRAATSADLKLSIAPAAIDVAPGTPVTLRATIEARKANVAGVPDVSPESGNFELWVLNMATGERTQYTGPGWKSTERAPESRTITPAEPAIRDLTVALPPGRYEFSMQYTGLGPDAPLYAQTKMTVRQPASPDEVAWWEALQADVRLAASVQTFDFTGREETANKAEALIETHAGAPQAEAAALGLGKLYLHTRKNPSTALSFLRIAARPAADSGIRARALMEASAALVATGAGNEAESVLRQAATEAKDAALLREIKSKRLPPAAAVPPIATK